ncbi:MAG: hypothetical protein GQ570_01685 [Helicobacteraceae bacterium]|nr:hypothetical protein [Helicobacteraceae bacterium]
MAKLDRAKEYIGFLKAIFIMLVAIDSSLIAWLFKNSTFSFNSILVIIGISVSSIVIIILFKYVLKKIVELEEIV